MAHELTHVVQQRSGPVAGTPAGDGIFVSDPSDPFEQAAEANAERVVPGALGQAGGPGAAGAAWPAPRGTVPEDDEPVQGLWVQRQDAEDNPRRGAGAGVRCRAWVGAVPLRPAALGQG